MGLPVERELVGALVAWQREQRLENAAMAAELGISRNYWLQLRSGRRPMTLEVSRTINHRFVDALVIRLLAQRFVDEWYATTPEAAAAVGAD